MIFAEQLSYLRNKLGLEWQSRLAQSRGNLVAGTAIGYQSSLTLGSDISMLGRLRSYVTRPSVIQPTCQPCRETCHISTD